MKLYEIPRNSKLLLPIGKRGEEAKDTMCDFHHIDGMYSYITTPSGSAVHLGASTEVKKVKDHYELV